ncbi:SAM-dependent methyltransferase [Marinactinospora rubrisoli]|uniref:SAM-dependent methyltransferase n=1 Tax=Marinactinospora rubrisoli TaxID=2715399 RepID=A0ABW2KHN2_9ACTN
MSRSSPRIRAKFTNGIKPGESHLIRPDATSGSPQAVNISSERILHRYCTRRRVSDAEWLQNDWLMIAGAGIGLGLTCGIAVRCRWFQERGGPPMENDSMNWMKRQPKAEWGKFPEIDTTHPSVIRVYDFLLGGKDNFAVDREAGRKLKQVSPELVEIAQAGRGFVRRVVRFLTREAGIRQIVDVGSGLPSARKVHEVAHAEAPDTRVVYLDNDPVALVHGRALLADNHNTSFIYANLLQPGEMMAALRDQELIDFDEPVAMLVAGALHRVMPEHDAPGIVRELLAPLPVGSYLCLATLVNDGTGNAAKAEVVGSETLGGMHFRRSQEVRALFDGLELVPPGFGCVSAWRPDDPEAVFDPEMIWCMGAVARKTRP